MWRKVGRREPAKAARKLGAPSRPPSGRACTCRASTVRSRTKFVDRECRPYELGWLLYAWLRSASERRSTVADEHVAATTALTIA